MTLDDLIARVEAAEGPDRRLDVLIHITCNPAEQTIVGHVPGPFPRKAIYGPITELIEMAEHGPYPNDAADYIGAPRYTASLDNALLLVPDQATYVNIETCARHTPNQHCRAEVSWLDEQETESRFSGYAATPALALTAACLRAMKEK